MRIAISGPQWNYDIQMPEQTGDWVHCGSDMIGAPPVAPGDEVSYWLYASPKGVARSCGICRGWHIDEVLLQMEKAANRP